MCAGFGGWEIPEVQDAAFMFPTAPSFFYTPGSRNTLHEFVSWDSLPPRPLEPQSLVWRHAFGRSTGAQPSLGQDEQFDVLMKVSQSRTQSRYIMLNHCPAVPQFPHGEMVTMILFLSSSQSY